MNSQKRRLFNNLAGEIALTIFIDVLKGIRPPGQHEPPFWQMEKGCSGVVGIHVPSTSGSSLRRESAGEGRSLPLLCFPPCLEEPSVTV